MEEPTFYPRRRCCSSSSNLAETVANVEDLLTEILVRLPAASLVRFKCVSKRWLSLISDPKFCHRHTLRNPNTPISAVFSVIPQHQFRFVPLPLDDRHTARNPSPSCSPFSPLHDSDRVRVIQSCNGLFLCHISSAREVKPPFFVLNPTTNQFSTLIPPTPALTEGASGQQVEPCIVGIALAFDPSKSPHYKVVCLRAIDGVGSLLYILIYSSESRSWKLIDSSFSMKFRISFECVVFCNGAIHWLGWRNELLYFGVDEERIGFAYPPPYSKERHSVFGNMIYTYFQESADRRHLHLINIHYSCLSEVEVLEMAKDYSGWFVKYFVDLYPLCTAYPWFQFGQFIILFLDQDEIGEECSSLLLHTPGKLISYNLKSKSFKYFELAPKTDIDDRLLRVGEDSYRYMETLACV